MVDQKFRKALDNYIEECGVEAKVIILDDHAYDKSIVGITENGRLVYDFAKMIKEFASDEKCSELEAIEWLEYNTLRAIPYMGENAPIVLIENTKSLMTKYGE